MPDQYEVIFAIDKVDFHRRQGELETLLEVAVSPDNNAEIRQLRIINHSDQTKYIEVTSYAEVSLAKPAADLAHPAFQKLFIETEFIEDEAALIARRRPRDSEQKADWAVQVLAVPSENVSKIRHETSRQAFLGRRRSVRSPQFVEGSERNAVNQSKSANEGTTGAVLDPIFSLSCQLEIPPGASTTIAFTTAVAESRQDALTLADQYHELRNVQRVFELAWAYAQVELRHQHLTPGQVHLYQRLASYLLYPHWSLRGNPELIKQNRLGQSGLWRHGISGDLPILLAHVNEPEQLGFVRELAMAQRFWRERGFVTDLILINDYPGSYFDALQDQIVSLLREIFHSPEHPHVYLLRGSQLPHDEVALFEAVAACVLHGDQGTVVQQIEAAQARALQRIGSRDEVASYEPTLQKATNAGPDDSVDPHSLEFWNGTGGFANDGREYHIRVNKDHLPPMPWSQVVANERLGFLATESGGGYTWFENSRENKLTTWSNDPVSDSPSELLYVKDLDTKQTWLPFTCLPRTSNATHDAVNEGWAKYGAGYAVFEKQDASWTQRVHLSVAESDPVKFIELKLTNRAPVRRNISVTYFAELVLGVTREQAHWHLQSTIDDDARALICRNPYHPEYSSQTVFVKSLEAISSYTADRAEFLGRNGSWEKPAGLRRSELMRRTGVGFDPCAALQVTASLEPGETRVFTFMLGAGRDEAEANALLKKYSTREAVDQAREASFSMWRTTLGRVQVKTPNRSLDILVNYWLIYQVLSCRMWGRSAFYQSGGAFGFRDQLQDSMAIVYSRPDLVRAHLLLAASRQFVQGDVQHWWHPPLGKGTRTRFSDDLLWLAFTTCHYVQVTRDAAVLDEVVPFLESPELKEHEIERYEMPRVSTESASLYEHCIRAMNKAMKFGVHGLPLMGCGDWNDGMNKVGEGGKGESVWVGWFLLVLIKKFEPVMRARGDDENLQRFQAISASLREALETQAWDGAWYRRAYFDDGSPLGSAQNDECQIDSLTQSWAVFADANAERSRGAMAEAVKRLVQVDAGLILLFTPPFDQGESDPGYIKGYLPGIRENGGQYTHAATWMIQALAQLGENEKAMELLNLINPINHTLTPEAVGRYQTEPYVIAADVYGVHPHEGRGGWTWYTGSAAWLYRVIVEKQLGLTVSGDDVSLEPHLPANWKEIEVTLTNPPKSLKWDR